jgi:uncharacterized phage protein (TIGR01671 family)
MREIKFRAWDRDSKKWYPYDFYVKDSKAWELEDDGSCGDPECCGGPDYYMGHMEHLIVTQYTGLKDKNGKEIYEGDIVYVAGVGNCEITFRHGSFGYEHNSILFESFINDGELDIESVIGNIYENPELLEKETQKK